MTRLSVATSVAARSRPTRPLALAATLLLTACATNPATGRRELSLIPKGQEIAMGQQGAQAAAAEMGIYADSALQRYVQSLGMPIARSSERADLPWSFTIVDDPIVNAFALPGGPIFVSRGILAYMNSEAQLVSVLGHEIGHVTAKHSVNQMSKQQVLQIGMIGAMVLRPELQQYGEAMQQGLGVLFLKFSRDDEIQADDLGFRYMTAQQYAPSEMAEMFKILQRVSGGSTRSTPEWMSTHPDPGNRVLMTAQRIAGAGQSFAGAKVERDAFLRRIDGIVFGDDPRTGYFQQGTTFIHPTLQFSIAFPAGWQTQNSAQQVVGVSGQRDAQMALTLAGRVPPQQALQAFLQQQGIQPGAVSVTPINGNPAAIAQFIAQNEDRSQLAGYVAFIQQDGMTYRVLTITPRQSVQAYDGVFRAAIGSFQRVTDPRLLNVRPARVRVVRLSSAMTLAQFHQQQPSVIPLERLAQINAMEPTTMIPAGTLVKKVVVE
jgi:predicted Zn-dependent protease